MGSDYPIPVSEICHNRRTDFFSWLRFIVRMTRLRNPLDKNYLLIREMGFTDCVFTNAAGLFSSVRRPGRKGGG
jgi:hypothetical protein